MDQLRLRLLGGISLTQGDEERFDQLPAKALALLCYLAVTGKVQTRDALSSLLWSDFPEHRARGNLRDTLTNLRKTAFVSFLDIGRRVVSFKCDAPYWLDTAEFQRGVQQGGKMLPEDPTILETALALYQGEFLDGFQVQRAPLFEEWVAIKRQELHLLAADGLQKLVEHHLDAGSYETGIRLANRLLSLDPWREETHRNLMLLLFLDGDANAALQQYEQCKQILADELVVAPSHETEKLHENIRKQIGGGGAIDKGHLAAGTVPLSSAIIHNIPRQVTRFIGRDKEQRAIDIVLGDQTARLVTIFGVGGSGKTRLALAIGEKQLHKVTREGAYRFADGVFFVPMEAVETASEVIPTLCQALSFQPADESRSGRTIEGQLLDYLRHKRMLLIIDNFEHLFAEVGLLAKIVRTASDVRLLVTSRQKLGLQSERLYALEGLPYPQVGKQEITAKELIADYSAAAMFVACAQRGKADFQLKDEEVPAVIELCHLVDGLPLALELAAGWTTILSLDDITAEIEQGLSFLESAWQDLPDRHHSMQAVFDVTWRQLLVEEQAIFAQLCVFRGGFNRQAAAYVVGARLQQLAALANKGLIQYDREMDRYRIHRLLRQFGVDKLTHDPAAEKLIRERHCAYYCAALQQWDALLKGPAQLETLAILDIESANARSAWNFAVETSQFTQIDRGADGLGRFYLWRRRFHEGEKASQLVEETLSQAIPVRQGKSDASEIKRILAKVQIWQSLFCEQAKAKALVSHALELLDGADAAAVDTRRDQAFGLLRAGDLAFKSAGQDPKPFYQQSLSLYQALGDIWEQTQVLAALGWVAAHHGAIEEAHKIGEEALDLARAVGDCKLTADVLWLLGTLAIIEGDVEESSRLLGESIDIRKTVGDRVTDIVSGPLDLGMTLTWIGRMAEADKIREEALAIYEEQGQSGQIALAHVRLATSKMHVGQFEAMKQHAQIGLQLSRKAGSQRGAGLALWLLGSYSIAKGQLDRAALRMQESLAIFRSIEGAAEIGWVLATFGVILQQQGKPVDAQKYICDALHHASGVLGLITILMSLVIYMELLIDKSQEVSALEIHTLLKRYPLYTTSPAWSFLNLMSRLAAVRAALPAEAAAAAEARGYARDLQETAAEVLVELEGDLAGLA